MEMTKKTNETNMLQVDDPFLRGRTEAAERYGHLSKNAAQWRRISLVLLICCAICVFTVIFMAHRITVVPYIVQVDSHGYEIAVRPLSPANVDARLIMARIGSYIRSLRTVFNDETAQLYLMNFVYNSTPTGTAAAVKYRTWYGEHDPMALGKNETVNVDVKSVLPLSEKTWQAEWTEDTFTASTGDRVSTKYYRGIFTTALAAPKAMSEIQKNPLGIMVTDFNISEVAD